MCHAVVHRCPPPLPHQVTFNGDDLQTGAVVTSIAKYVEQEDRHLPLLTVRETLEYAERFQAAVCVCRLHRDRRSLTPTPR